MTHESLTFTDVYHKFTENNPPYTNGQVTAVVVTPHQRRGGMIIEFAFEDTAASKAQALAQRNFKDALLEWGEVTGAYRLLPSQDLIVGSVAIDFRTTDETVLAPRQVLAAIECTPHVHVDFLQADEQIG